jgi:hypothetical protein
MEVTGGRDVRKAAQLFIDCLRRCGEAYGATHQHRSCMVDLMSDDDDSCADATRHTTNDNTSASNSNSISWEALSPYKDALALAVEAATCILTLDHAHPVIVANPLELRK